MKVLPFLEHVVRRKGFGQLDSVCGLHADHGDRGSGVIVSIPIVMDAEHAKHAAESCPAEPELRRVLHMLLGLRGGDAYSHSARGVRARENRRRRAAGGLCRDCVKVQW